MFVQNLCMHTPEARAPVLNYRSNQICQSVELLVTPGMKKQKEGSNTAVGVSVPPGRSFCPSTFLIYLTSFTGSSLMFASNRFWTVLLCTCKQVMCLLNAQSKARENTTLVHENGTVRRLPALFPLCSCVTSMQKRVLPSIYVWWWIRNVKMPRVHAKDRMDSPQKRFYMPRNPFAPQGISGWTTYVFSAQLMKSFPFLLLFVIGK